MDELCSVFYPFVAVSIFAEAASAVNFKLVLCRNLVSLSANPGPRQGLCLGLGLGLSHRPGQLMSLLGYPPVGC